MRELLGYSNVEFTDFEKGIHKEGDKTFQEVCVFLEEVRWYGTKSTKVLTETTIWFSGSSQGTTKVDHTWMRPVDTVSLLNIIPNSLPTPPLSRFPPQISEESSPWGRSRQVLTGEAPFTTPLHIGNTLAWVWGKWWVGHVIPLLLTTTKTHCGQ